MNKTIFDLTEVLTVIGIDYRSTVKKLHEEYEAERMELPKRYIGKELASQRDALDNMRKAKMIDLQETCKDSYKSILEDLEWQARKSAGIVSRKAIEDVSAFLNIPLTADEFGALAKSLGGTNYYSDRILETIAKKNGISYAVDPMGDEVKIEPSLKVKLDVLHQLDEQAEHLLATFGTPDENTASRVSDLFPQVLKRAEDLYTNGLYEDQKTLSQKALYVISNAKMEGGRCERALNHALENASPDLKAAILYELKRTEDNYLKRVGENILKTQNVSETVNAIEGIEQADKDLASAIIETGVDGLYQVFDQQLEPSSNKVEE